MKLLSEQVFDIYNFMDLMEHNADCKCIFTIEASGFPVVEILAEKNGYDDYKVFKYLMKLKEGSYSKKIVSYHYRDTSFEDDLEGFKHIKIAVWFYRCF